MRISGKLYAFALCMFVAGIAYAEATDADKKTVASKAYVDTKQDIIETGLVEFNGNPDFMLPAITTYDSTSGLVSNKIGILDWQTAADVEGTLNLFSYDAGGYGSEMDNYVPTVRAVAEALQSIWDNMPSWTALTWDSAETTSTNAYDITFVGDTGATTNAWPRADRTKLINTAALAQGLALKQNKLPAQNTNLVPGQQIVNGVLRSVIAPTATAGVVQQVALWDADGGDPTSWDINEYFSDYTNAERNAIWQSIPTVNAVVAGLNNKQDQITTGLVTFREPEENIDYTVPALVSYGTGTNNSDGVLGNKIGILGIHENRAGLDSWEFLNIANDSEAAYLDNFVPTVRAVAATLALKQNKLGAKASNARAQAVTRSSAAGNTASAYITAGGSVGLTTRSGAPAIIGYVNGTAVTDSTAMTTFTTGTFGSNSATNQDYIKNALVSLELLKDVYSELNTKITNNALPTGTTGTVVTYNGTNATTGVQEFTETAVASAASYDSTTGALDNGDNIANVTFVETKQKKKTCAGYESGHENDPDYCWLWNFPE